MASIDVGCIEEEGGDLRKQCESMADGIYCSLIEVNLLSLQIQIRSTSSLSVFLTAYLFFLKQVRVIFDL